MKKLAIGLLFVAGIAGAACMGPYCYDDTGATINGFALNGKGLMIPNASSTTINASTSSGVGQLVVCTTCANIPGSYGVCMSTTSGVSNSWVVVNSTFTAGALTACK